MKEKKGFIAISLLYSFFLCFIALMMGLLANYTHSHLIIKKLSEPQTYINDKTLLSRIKNSNQLITETPDFSKGEPPLSGTNTGSGLYTMEDDDGISYYFRGQVENNYVIFAGKTWRVVRINGDESIRLILDESLESAVAFNNKFDEEKYVGYTYDNENKCLSNNPCSDNDGTSSDIKEYLTEWYDDNILAENLDKYIESTTFCADTSFVYNDIDELNEYGARLRLIDAKPQLKCSNTSLYFGGAYKLRIGLINADELMLAGLNFSKTNTNNFLYSLNSYWTLSPNDTGSYYGQSGICFDNAYGGLNACSITEELYVRPVSNLKSDVLVASGNGTSQTPYTIDVT